MITHALARALTHARARARTRTRIQVIYYLAFIVRGGTKTRLVFPHLLPRLNVLMPVYHALHDALVD